MKKIICVQLLNEESVAYRPVSAYLIEKNIYKIDGSELYEYQQQLLQPPEDIPIWEKKCLTVEEAAAYSGIGERRLKALLMDKDCSFRIARSDRLLIIREKLEEFIDSSTEL